MAKVQGSYSAELTSNAFLTVKDPELVEAAPFLQPASCSNTGSSCTNYNDWIERLWLSIVSVVNTDA
jgi:hypothetical protein